MAYIVKFIKDFSDKAKINSVCLKDVSLGYKVMVFSDCANKCDLQVENTTFTFCDDAKMQAVEAARKHYAEKCQFYVEHAVYSVDPNVYPEASKIKEMDYEAAQELLVNGYNEIDYNVINLAKRGSVRLEILSLTDSEPTTIKEVAAVDSNVIRSISEDSDIAVVTLTERPDQKGETFKILKLLSDEDIYVDSIMLSAPAMGHQNLSVCIRREDKPKVQQLLEGKRSSLDFKNIIFADNVAKISVMGSGFHNQKGVAAKLLEVLYSSDINIMMIFTSEVKISIVIEKQQANKAIRAIHKNLIKQ